MENILIYLAVFSHHLLRFVLIAGIPFLIWYILMPHKFRPNKIQSRKSRQADWIRELKHSLQTIFIFASVTLVLILTPIGRYLRVYSDLDAYPLWWIPISIGLAVIVHDTYFYWMHRTIHHKSLYPRFHIVHHRSINPTPLTSHAFNLSEGLLEALSVPVILLLIPMHPLSILIFTVMALLVNVYGHLGYEIMPRWFRHSVLFEILNTSVHHNLHHERFRGNYGYYFRVWDRIMGTEHLEYVSRYDQIQAVRFGELKQAENL